MSVMWVMMSYVLIMSMGLTRLMLVYFQYLNYMIGYHYEEGTVRFKEEVVKESADEMPDEIFEQIKRNDRGGEYYTTDEMK